MVPATGVEPAHAFAYQCLKLARLPKSATPASTIDFYDGGDGGSRTRPAFRPQSPQDCASTRSATSPRDCSRGGGHGGTRTLTPSPGLAPEASESTNFTTCPSAREQHSRPNRDGARRGSRTPTPSPTGDLESPASTVPPHGHHHGRTLSSYSSINPSWCRRQGSNPHARGRRF